MAILTVREKGQVTLPGPVLHSGGLKVGDPIEVAAMPGGGVGVYPYGTSTRRQSAWDVATAIAAGVPGIEETELDLPRRGWEPPREIDL